MQALGCGLWGWGVTQPRAADLLGLIAPHTIDPERIDCRTCRNLLRAVGQWPGSCVATLRCVDGGSYKAGAPVQLWEESPREEPF